MKRVNRREFLRYGGATVAATLLTGPLAERLLAAERAAGKSTPTTSNDLEGHFADDCAAIVADLRRKFPYASALYAAQNGISISRDRNGKRVSESGFPSRGV